MQNLYAIKTYMTAEDVYEKKKTYTLPAFQKASTLLLSPKSSVISPKGPCRLLACEIASSLRPSIRKAVASSLVRQSFCLVLSGRSLATSPDALSHLGALPEGCQLRSIFRVSQLNQRLGPQVVPFPNLPLIDDHGKIKVAPIRILQRCLVPCNNESVVQ